MKKIIAGSALLALLLTSVQANFSFADMFNDLQHIENSKAQTVKAPSTDFVFGDVFKDLKHTVNTQSYTAKAPGSDYVFGDVFKDLKTPVQS